MDTTGKSLAEHWVWAAQKGLMNKNSANGFKAACSQVLGILDDWQNIDVTTIDPEDVSRRFKTLRAKDFKPRSLEVYEQRFKNALSSYLSYVQDPGAWRPSRRTHARRSLSGSSETSSSEKQTDPGLVRADSTRGGLVDYPFPLRDGLIARLILPRDMKMAEVKRLNAFMSTLTVDFAAENAAGEQ